LKASAARIAARRAGGGVAIEWQLGNMPRIPKTWEESGAPAYASARERHDTRHWEEMRLERERKAAEEVAARAAELSGLRRARDDATRQAAAAEAATASAKASSDAHLVKMQVAYDTRIAAIEAKAVADAKLAACSGAGDGGGDATTCIVCLDAPRRVALQPCGHYSFCKGVCR